MLKYAKWSDTYLCMDMNTICVCMTYIYMYTYVYGCQKMFMKYPKAVYDCYDLVLRGRREDEPLHGPIFTGNCMLCRITLFILGREIQDSIT